MEEDQLRVMDMFRQYDRDGDNKISKEELHDYMEAQGLTWKEGQLDRIMASLDADGDGFISMQEFKNACRAYTRHILRGKKRHSQTGDSTKRRNILKKMRDKTFGSRASRQRTAGFFQRRASDPQKGGWMQGVENNSFPDFPKFVAEWSKLVSQVCSRAIDVWSRRYIACAPALLE